MSTHTISQDRTTATTWVFDVVGLVVAISPALIFPGYLLTH